jgi:hypothetical protein
MAGDAGVPFTEIPAMVLNLARERGWLPREEAAKLRAELAAAERDRDEARAIAAEGRAAGRAEAAAILMEQEADSILDDLTSSTPIGDTGDYSAGWEREKVLHLFDATGSAALSLIDRLDGAYWEATARAEDALRSAALRREEREPRATALDEAARVVEFADLHWHEGDPRIRIAAAIRALSSPATNPDEGAKP